MWVKKDGVTICSVIGFKVFIVTYHQARLRSQGQLAVFPLWQLAIGTLTHCSFVSSPCLRSGCSVDLEAEADGPDAVLKCLSDRILITVMSSAAFSQI